MSIWQVTQLTFHPSEHSEGVSPWHVFKLPNAMWPIFTTYIILCNHYHSLNRNRMPWCLMCRALHRHHAACPVALVPIYLCCWPSSWPSICKLDGSPSGQSTSEHWKSRKSQEILQRGTLILWMEGVYNQEMPVLWWPSYLANLGKHLWMNSWARLLHDWPSRKACGLHWICHVDLWICVALSWHPGWESPCFHLLYNIGPMPKYAQIIAGFLSGETSSMVQYQNPVHTQLLCRACHWKSWKKEVLVNLVSIYSLTDPCLKCWIVFCLLISIL